MSRILDLNVGDREMTVTLGRLSSALPSSVLVSNFRLTDTGVEMTLQTTQEDLDLGAARTKRGIQSRHPAESDGSTTR